VAVVVVLFFKEYLIIFFKFNRGHLNNNDDGENYTSVTYVQSNVTPYERFSCYSCYEDKLDVPVKIFTAASDVKNALFVSDQDYTKRTNVYTILLGIYCSLIVCCCCCGKSI
jgi:hypothetical protein